MKFKKLGSFKDLAILLGDKPQVSQDAPKVIKKNTKSTPPKSRIVTILDKPNVKPGKPKSDKQIVYNVPDIKASTYIDESASIPKSPLSAVGHFKNMLETQGLELVDCIVKRKLSFAEEMNGQRDSTQEEKELIDKYQKVYNDTFRIKD